MPIRAAEVDTVPSDSLASQRQRAPRIASFPEPAEANGDVEREVVKLRALLVQPLRELVQTTLDAGARAVAEAALAGCADNDTDDLGRLEDALERVASTTSDDTARALAEDAVALYRGR